ncbi:MAG: S41 family peptidase [Candidatus Eisenbacteria bacterium]
MKRLFAFACLLASSCLAATAVAAPMIATIPRDAMRDDLRVLRRALEAVHPGLERYQSRAEFAARFAALERELDHDVRRDTAFVAIARFAASVRCGHTHASPYNQGKLVTAEVVQRGGRVPFQFVWFGRRMIVTRDLRPAGATPALPRGTEVRSLNGARASGLLARMLPIAAADGHNDAKRISQLEVQGRSKYELFDVLLPHLVAGVEDSIVLVVRRPGEARDARVVAAPLDWKARADAFAALEAEGGAVPFTLDFSDSAFALLRMPTWAVYNSDAPWDSLLDVMLDRVVASGRPALVVDLRGNAGGNDCGDLILQRVVRTETRFESERRFVRFRRTPAELNAALDTWDDSFRDQTARTDSLPDERGLHRLKGGDEVAFATIRPREPAFRGRLFVLVGPDNSSATFQFAQRVQERRLGTLVGRPTGGNRRGINGGQFFFLRLPQSRIEVDLPVIAYFPPRPQPDAGLVPDAVVPLTRAGIESGRDAELDAVRRELARAGR